MTRVDRDGMVRLMWGADIKTNGCSRERSVQKKVPDPFSLVSEMTMANPATLIEKAIHDVDAEILAHAEGRGTVSNETQLSKFRATLENMAAELRGEDRGSIAVGMGRVIADSWPYTSVLGETIVSAEQAFVRERR